MKLEIKKIVEREVKLKPGWTVKQEDDAPAFYAPDIPDMLLESLWSEWEETFVYRPRKSIYGKFIWGKVYRRAVTNAWGKVELLKEHPEWKEQWANKKELFRWKLNGS